MTVADRVSVVIPTFNYGAFIGHALDSVLQQRWSNVEIIVIDDGSDDDTAQVIAPYLADSRVHYHSQPRSGPAAARNRGVTLASGEYIAFLDADDFWPDRDMLTRVVYYLAQHTTTGWLFGDAEPFDARGVTDVPYLLKGGFYQASSDTAAPFAITPDLLCNNGRFFIPMGAVIIRKRCLDQIGLFDPALRMFEDTDLWLRLRQFPCAFLPRVMLARRLHATNISHQRWAHLEDLKLLIDRYDLEQYGVYFNFHAARAGYHEGRHWYNERDFAAAARAFRASLRYHPRWKPAVYWLFATARSAWQTLASARNNN